MSIPRVRRDAVVELPPIEALDSLDAQALIAVAQDAAALYAGAQARLTQLNVSAREPAADEYLTAEDVAQLLKAEPSWVYRHASPLGGVKLDGILRFSRRRLDSYVLRQQRVST